MARKKRHHYIPVFYLKGFIDPYNKPYIWAYEKGNSRIIKATAENLAVKEHYYSFPTPDGEKDTETFEYMLHAVENTTAPVIRKIKNNESLSDQERADFSLFLGIMMTRVPGYRQKVEKMTADFIRRMNKFMACNPEILKAEIEKWEEDSGEKMDIPIEDLRKFIIDDEYNIEIKPYFSLGFVRLANDFAPIFFNMKWAFYRATDDYKFVTSDSPLFFTDPTHDPNSFYGVGLANKNVEITFPISKDLSLVATWKGIEGYVQCKNRQVKEITRRTVLSAARFVYASRKSEVLNRLVQKYKGIAPRIEVK